MKRAWILTGVVAVCGCTTETKERNLTGMWEASRSQPAPDDRSAPPPEREEPREAPVGTVVDIPPAENDRMLEFVNRRSTLMADTVEVEMSRDGWFALATFAISPDAVERRDEEDKARGLLTITLTRRPDVARTVESIPTVRFGDGMRVAGVERVVLRIFAAHSAERPFWFHAVGSGPRAFYVVESEPPQEWRGSGVELRSEMRRRGATWKFDWSAEARP